MSIDLRTLRDRANMTQTELAGIVGVRQSDVVRFERDPDRIPFAMMLKVLEALGVDSTELTSGRAVAGPADAGDPYWQIDGSVADLVKHAQNRPDLADESFARGAGTVARMARRTRSITRPVVGLFGGFDAGKSTLINALLGQSALGASYTPATSVATYLRHTNARPSWLTENVLILGEGFDPERWDDPDHIQDHRITAGDLDTLRHYGTHGGRNADAGATHALVFLDSPILRAATLVDLPGYENDATDTARAAAHHARIDIALYLSPYNGFMPQGDLTRLGTLLLELPQHAAGAGESVPGLANLFVIGSHAARTSVSDADLEHIFDRFVDRAWVAWDAADADLETKGAVTFSKDDLRARCFPFWSNQGERHDALVNDLTELLRGPYAHDREQFLGGTMREELDRLVGELDSQRRSLEHRLADVATARAELEEGLANEPARRREVADKIGKIKSRIDRKRRASFDAVDTRYETIVTTDNVEDLIVSRFTDKKDAQKHIGATVYAKLQKGIDEDVLSLSKGLSSDIDELIHSYTTAKARFAGADSLGSADIPFDPRGAFLGGVAGAAGVGALAVWAGTLGNLGAYIIAAKAVSVLSALGISISGGTATATAAMATIGGPVTVAVAIVALAALAGWALFGSSWERRLAKGVVKQFDKQQIRMQLRQSADKYWSDTERAVDDGSHALERDWQTHLSKLRQITEDAESNPDLIRARIADVVERRAFVADAPWPYEAHAPTEPLNPTETP